MKQALSRCDCVRGWKDILGLALLTRGCSSSCTALQILRVLAAKRFGRVCLCACKFDCSGQKKNILVNFSEGLQCTCPVRGRRKVQRGWAMLIRYQKDDVNEVQKCVQISSICSQHRRNVIVHDVTGWLGCTLWA